MGSISQIVTVVYGTLGSETHWRPETTDAEAGQFPVTGKRKDRENAQSQVVRKGRSAASGSLADIQELDFVPSHGVDDGRHFHFGRHQQVGIAAAVLGADQFDFALQARF